MLLTVISFLLVLSVLVFIHELGHYLAARHVGVRVLQFSIGFGKPLFRRQVGETEYRFAWILIGGYVRLLGQNLDDEDPADPRNYASKTIPQRLYILAAGPVMNLLLALVLMPLVFVLGVEMPAYRNAAPVMATVATGTPAAAAGFRAGDRIVSVDGTATPTWNAAYEALAQAGLQTGSVGIAVERDGRTVQMQLPRGLLARGKAPGWRPRIPPVVGFIAPNSAAEAAGLVKGDRILRMDGTPIARWHQISEQIQQRSGRTIALRFERQGRPITVSIAPRFDAGADRWLIGISPGTNLERHGPLDALVLGTTRLMNITGATFYFLGQLLLGQGSADALGGPVKIGAVIGQAVRSGLAELVFLMAVISLQLGIFNLLPVPALDGGHIFMLGLERLKGSPLSHRFRERAQLVGITLILLLIVFVTYNDIVGLVS